MTEKAYLQLITAENGLLGIVLAADGWYLIE